MSLQLHSYQNALVRALITYPHGAHFNSLLVEGLESEHMNYHLKKLIEYGLVEKKNMLYSLTDTGKDYCNLTDDEMRELEKQPKTSVILWCTRINPQGEREHLINRRLRHPYYGKVGRLTGKVRYGETLVQAAKRELYEETGLEASSCKLVEIYHKLRTKPDGEVVQDVLFYIVQMEKFTGHLIEKTKYQENFWLSEKNPDKNAYDFFDDFEMRLHVHEGELIPFHEHSDVATGY